MNHTHPGWYESPNYPGQLQYWNGEEWLPQVKPMPVKVDGPPPTGEPYINTSPAPTIHTPTQKMITVKPKWILRVIAGFLFFVALIPLSITTPSVIESLAGNKTEVVGKVIDLDRSTYTSTNSKSRSRTSKPSCAPIAEYTVNGQKYTARSSVFTAPCPHSIGETVTVKYDNDNPSSAKIKLSGAIGVMMWVFFAAGLAFLLTGLGLLVKSFTLKKE